MLLFDLVPPDTTAAVLDLLDARDVLRAAAATRRPWTALLPRGWTFQARRPLTVPEHTGLLGVGVPRVQLWSECPFKPDRLRRVSHSYRVFFGGLEVCEDVYQDESGILFKDQHSGIPNAFHHWTVLRDPLLYQWYRDILVGHRMLEGRLRASWNSEKTPAPPLLLEYAAVSD